MSVPRKGMLAWLHGEAAAPSANEITPQRRQWEHIERLLADHDLEPTPANFEAIHAYVAGEADARRAIDAALAAPDGLSRAAMDAIVAARGGGVAVVADIAERLERQLSELLGILGQQASSARDYGAALDREAQNAAGDPAGAFERLIAMTRDAVAATRQLEERLERAQAEAERLRSDLTSARLAADSDYLTALPNRRLFDAQLAQQASGCVALCDIDDFKRINDVHGHETGDRVLKFVATTLRRELNGQALVARYGGEEFACLFHTADMVRARAALDTIRKGLRKRALADRTSGAALGRLTFSAGLAPVAADDARAALRAADTALYRAKRLGKDRVEAAA